MDLISTEEVWRRIAPEEKLTILAKAHAQGTLVSLVVIIVCSTIAIGLRLSPLVWGSVLLSPFVFQIAAGRAWRSLKPVAMLEFLAARSAARRFAFALNARELSVDLLFRGTLLTTVSYIPENGPYQSLVAKEVKRTVWIALFPDSLVVLSESPEGAQLEFSHLIDDKLSIEGISPPGKKDYSRDRLVIVRVKERRSDTIREIKLKSACPAALIVFERILQKYILENANIPKSQTLPAAIVEEADEFDFPTFM